MDKKILTQVVREVKRSLSNWDIKKAISKRKAFGGKTDK